MDTKLTAKLLNEALKEMEAAVDGGHVSHPTYVAAYAAIWAVARHEGFAPELERLAAQQ